QARPGPVAPPLPLTGVRGQERRCHEAFLPGTPAAHARTSAGAVAATRTQPRRPATVRSRSRSSGWSLRARSPPAYAARKATPASSVGHGGPRLPTRARPAIAPTAPAPATAAIGFHSARVNGPTPNRTQVSTR